MNAKIIIRLASLEPDTLTVKSVAKMMKGKVKVAIVKSNPAKLLLFFPNESWGSSLFDIPRKVNQ